MTPTRKMKPKKNMNLPSSQLNLTQLSIVLLLLLLIVVLPTVSICEAISSAVYLGFTLVSVFQGLNQPVAARFSSDGRVFVAEKQGKVYAFDSESVSANKVVVVDVGLQIQNWGDRGLTSIQVAPAPGGNGTLLHLYVWFVAAPPDGAACTKVNCKVFGKLLRYIGKAIFCSGIYHYIPLYTNILINLRPCLVVDACYQY